MSLDRQAKNGVINSHVGRKQVGELWSTNAISEI